MKMFSSLALKPNANFEFGKEIIIRDLVITKNIYDDHVQKYRTSFPKDSPEVTKKKVEALLSREYIIGAIFDHLIPLFNFNLDKTEFDKNVETFKINTQTSEISSKENEMIIKYIDRLLKQQLIINYFVANHEPKLFPTKEESYKVLEDYYKKTNKAIRELKSGIGIVAVQDTICQERFVEWITKKFLVKFKLNDKQGIQQVKAITK